MSIALKRLVFGAPKDVKDPHAFHKLSLVALLVSLAGLVVFAILAARSRTEEEKLLERFGEPYRAYQTRTGRFLPRVS